MTEPNTDRQNAEADVVDELTSDHREALALLDRLANSIDAEQRRDLADTVIAEVVRHAVAEEMYVYPAMREHVPDGEQAVEHDIEEHKQLEGTMKQLEAADPGEPRFDSLVREMTEQLRHHAYDEETEQFPRLRERIPRDELVRLREKVDDGEEARAHPTAPLGTQQRAVPQAGRSRSRNGGPTSGPAHPPQYGLIAGPERVATAGSVRGAAASVTAAALRLPAGGRRGAGQLGRAQGADAGSEGPPHRGPGRRPSAGVPRFRGDHPAGSVRRRRCDRVGPRHLDPRRHRRPGRGDRSR